MANEFSRQVAEQQIGGKTRLRDFDGVGETTLREMRSKGFRDLDDVQSATTAELAEVDGIGQKKAKQIKQQAPRDTATSRTSGSVSAAGIRSPVGDFKVGLGDKDSIDARHTTRARGDNAVRTDNRRRAPITTDKEKWVDNPGRYDYPGVDTPTDDPQLKRMDIRRGDVGRDDLTSDGQERFDELQSSKDQQPSFDRRASVGITPDTLGSGFTTQLESDTLSKQIGKGSDLIEQADEQLGLPSAEELDSTDVVAEVKVGFTDRDSGFGYDTEFVEARETDDTIFNFR